MRGYFDAGSRGSLKKVFTLISGKIMVFLRVFTPIGVKTIDFCGI